MAREARYTAQIAALVTPDMKAEIKYLDQYGRSVSGRGVSGSDVIRLGIARGIDRAATFLAFDSNRASDEDFGTLSAQISSLVEQDMKDRITDIAGPGFDQGRTIRKALEFGLPDARRELLAHRDRVTTTNLGFSDF